MNFVKRHVGFTNQYIKENLLKHLYIVGILFIVVTLVAYFGVKTQPATDIQEIRSAIRSIFESKDVEDPNNTLSFWGVFLNNLRAGVVTCLLGLIPFLFLPIFGIVLNAGIMGALVSAISVLQDMNGLMLFAKYILPHGIFEIPAIVLEGAIGVKLCVFLCRKIFGKAKDERFVYHVQGCFGAFVVYNIPLLLLAAFVETVVLSAIYL